MRSSLLPLSWSHAQDALLLDGLQLIGAYGLGDQVEFLTHGLMAVRQTDVRDVAAPDFVTFLSFLEVVRAQPIALYLKKRRAFIVCLLCCKPNFPQWDNQKTELTLYVRFRSPMDYCDAFPGKQM